MLTCVFRQEMMLAGRRRRTHRLRWIYTGLLLTQIVPLGFVAASYHEWLNVNFSVFFERLVILHFCLLALITPALVAAAITDEKTSGTLQYLLTAFLSPGEIVLGKLLARSFQLLLMSLVGLPWIAFVSGFGGVWSLPVALVVLSCSIVFGLAAASMLASVWCRQTRDAMLTIYLVGVSLLAARAFVSWRPLTALLDFFHPLPALAIEDGSVPWRRVGNCALAWSLLGGFCLAGAVLRLRGAYLRQLRAVPRAESRWRLARRPRLRMNPVLWRERHVLGLAPWPWLRNVPRWLACVLIAAVTVVSLVWALQGALPAGISLLDHVRAGRWLELRTALGAAPVTVVVLRSHAALALLITWVLVAVRASGCITEEREKATWEALLQTPLTTRAILRAKHWGIIWAATPVFASYALVALACSMLVGPAIAVETLVTLTATVFVILFTTAVGIWCSASATSSWASLMATLSDCFLCWLAVGAGVLCAGMCMMTSLLAVITDLTDWFAGLTPFATALRNYNWSSIGLAATCFVAFWFFTHRLLAAAEQHVDKRDRNKDVDPQHDAFHRRWLHKITRAAHIPKPIDAAVLNEALALASARADEAIANARHETLTVEESVAEDTDVPIPVEDVLGPAPNGSQRG